MRYMISPSITSYAVFVPKIVDGCLQEGSTFRYPASGSPNTLSSISCADAKAKFKIGGGTIPQTGGVPCPNGVKTASGNCQPSTLASQKVAFDKQVDTKAKEVKAASDNLNKTLGEGIFGKPDAPSESPAGCKNCTNANHWWSFLDPNQWGCKIGKISCEAGHAINDGFGGILNFMKDNALVIVGGGLVAIVILMTVLKRM